MEKKLIFLSFFCLSFSRFFGRKEEEKKEQKEKTKKRKKRKGRTRKPQ